MKMHCNLGERGYDIVLERGALNEISTWMDCERHYFIITDDGVPYEHVDRVVNQLKHADVFIIPAGEQSKCFETYQRCLKEMLNKKYTRSDCVIAIGGGVVGDLAGFVAATYMRGIDFINIPTTTLAQIDSSIGGKVAIDVDKIKNCIGAFHQPRLVIIDPNVLDTLAPRHFNNGLIEALKTGCIADSALFELFEKENYAEYIDEILLRSLEVKRRIVEADEKELGIRKILNFGHTIGHGIESALDFGTYYHGECVGLGMIAILENEDIKNRVIQILEKMGCPTSIDVDANIVYKYVLNDKKSKGETITIVQVHTLGEAILLDKELNEIESAC